MDGKSRVKRYYMKYVVFTFKSISCADTTYFKNTNYGAVEFSFISFLLLLLAQNVMCVREHTHTYAYNAVHLIQIVFLIANLSYCSL